MSFIDTLLLHYGWEGMALAGVILVMLFVQLYYYLFHYGAIPAYKATRRPRRLEKEPPVSLILAMYGEDYDFAERRLPMLLAQEHAIFEVVVVYVGSDRDFFEDLQHIRQHFPQLVLTKIEQNPHSPISPKQALNVGIKSAHYEHLILSTTDTIPQSDRWVALMAKGFTRGEVVLGYCGMERQEEPSRGLAGTMIRSSRLFGSMQWLASAIAGRPYRGIRHSFGFTKRLYFSMRNGFGFLNMEGGEDDLFLQQIMTRENTVAVLSPLATVRERIWGGMLWWLGQLKHERSTSAHYPAWVAPAQNWELGSRLLLLLAVVTALVVMPLEYKVAAALLWLLRLVVLLVEVRRIGARIGEKELWRGFILYDLWAPIERLLVALISIRRKPNAWK
uniref:glycosyltransferase n=1 Tax=Alistipes sp. TaxID=1872444 RepID=UPI0040569660